MAETSEKIAVIGLGYVGLPLAVALARKFPGTVGFDVNEAKVGQLRKGYDKTGEVAGEDLRRSTLSITSSPDALAGRTFYIIAVPTPVDEQNRPDLTPMVKASEIVGQAMQTGAVAVFESTVYPGVTEDICGPILERCSGLKRGVGFKLGYSPERINPGDKNHTLEKTVKIVSGEDEETLTRVAGVYGKIVQAGVYKAPSIKIAEAAKVIENTQRDLNIALMNELAMIFDRMQISTRDVLAAAGTKWNFLSFKPGLVGGHCIGVDPYYLTSKAEELGYHPQVILAGRRINDDMGAFVAQKAVKLLTQTKSPLAGARVGILGLTFKEDVPDLRNSKVPDIVAELKAFGIEPLVTDAYADSKEAFEEYGLQLSPLDAFQSLDALILAVIHKPYLAMPRGELAAMLKPRGVLVDVKSVLDPRELPEGILYWSL
jgi:UDP-N-acetyl-D-galactosamine dehydrogenase